MASRRTAAAAATDLLMLLFLSLAVTAATAQGAEAHPSGTGELRRSLSMSHITVSESELRQAGQLAGQLAGGEGESMEEGSSSSARRSLKALDHISIPDGDSSLVLSGSNQFAAASAPGLDPSEIVPVCGNKGKAVPPVYACGRQKGEPSPCVQKQG